MPRWVKKRMSERLAALAAFAIAAASSAASCDSSICASGPRFCDCPPPAGCPPWFCARLVLVGRIGRCRCASFGCDGSGCEKNRSKQAPSAFFSSSLLASVSSSVSRRMVRSSKPTLDTARIASMLSAGETCTPAPRAARKKRCRFSLMALAEHALAAGVGDEGRHMRQRGLDVGFCISAAR